MLITVFSVGADLGEATFTLDVGGDLQLADFKALCEAESGIPSTRMQVLLGERDLSTTPSPDEGGLTLSRCGLRDGDIIVLREGAVGGGAGAPPPPRATAAPQGPSPRAAGTTPAGASGSGLPLIDFGSIVIPSHGAARAPTATTAPPTAASSRRRPHSSSTTASSSSPHRSPGPAQPLAGVPGASAGGGGGGGGGGGSVHPLESDPRALREMLLSSPHDLALLKERNPPLADALLSGELERFAAVLREQREERGRRERERILLLNSDPFDIDAQARIAEDIRQQNVEENMSIAMEESPESFGQVVMLYINCIVNGHPVKAFVDSGAQMTIMSQAAAERCNIMRLVDRRWAGVAKGVGTQRIIGRVHLGQIQIEKDFLPSSFSILEEQPMDMLLGLDMLKRHQCVIDLKRGVLVLGSSGTETRFLTESELPACARLNGADDDFDDYGGSGGPRPSSPPPTTSGGGGSTASGQAAASTSLAQRSLHGDITPEELADRELAEALQRSANEAENQRR